ncbi:MAG: ABC transporter permease, partial [Acidobacteriota bacterium]
GFEAVDTPRLTEEIAATLSASPDLQAEVLSPARSASGLRLGKVALVVVPLGSYEYRFDPTRPESLLARTLVDEVLQQAAGRRDPVKKVLTPVTEPGARYIDFLIPGLIGMNLMSGGMWGLGFVIVEMRSRKLLKRLVAAPMRRSEFLSAMMASRIVFMIIEVVLLLSFSWLVFGVVIRGSLLTTMLLGLVGALCFGALGLLVASRAERIETVSGLMNVIMLPMFVFSGIFFSSDRFPDVLQPAIRLLPLTLLNDAFRAVIIEGADLPSQSGRILLLGIWGVACFALSLRWFRWT